jgi:hypothetical protein
MDYPRFARIEAPHEHLHLAYHGGGVVQAVLRLADRMIRARDRAVSQGGRNWKSLLLSSRQVVTLQPTSQESS